jgi:lysophospholipase L1-like esterase
LLRKFSIFIALFALTNAARGLSEIGRHWVGTWAAAPIGIANSDGHLGIRFSEVSGSTLREIVHVSIGGDVARITLSNEFGLEPLTIRSANIALHAAGTAIVPNSAVELKFGGLTSVTIPPGAMVLSDDVSMKVAPLSDLAISLFVPGQKITQLTCHSLANQTNYLVGGNAAGATTLDGAAETLSWDFLKAVDVEVADDSRSVVVFGDSITDGAHSTRNANARWSDVLARKLAVDRKTAHVSVLNEAIGGNRLLHDNIGPNALARFDRDVIAQAGVRYVVVLEGINDIGHTADPVKPYDMVSVADLIAALSQLAERAHTHGIKIIGATIIPYKGAKYASPAGEAMRQAINTFIRTSGKFDGVIDFDKLTRDIANPEALAVANDSGDHLHPGDVGYKTMGEGIDLKLFEK